MQVGSALAAGRAPTRVDGDVAGKSPVETGPDPEVEVIL
jgi:hypothetical protein